jgi:hypothetical protein
MCEVKCRFENRNVTQALRIALRKLPPSVVITQVHICALLRLRGLQRAGVVINDISITSECTWPSDFISN